MTGRVAAIIAAAGHSQRMGLNKMLVDLVGQPVIARSVSAVLSSRMVDEIFVCVPPGCVDDYRQAIGRVEAVVMEGGASRQETVYRGLCAAVDRGAARVLVHDGARPLAPVRLFEETLAALDHFDGAIAAVQTPDTVKQVVDGRVSGTIDRTTTWLAQTPQAFRASILLDAHRLAIEQRWEATDDAMLIERAGGTVTVVDGDRDNLKLTTPADLEFAARLISRETDIRVGLGFDIHPLVSGRPLILGGAPIDHGLGLDGHSDADVVCHAVMDAVLGAAGLDDIGCQFPNTDPSYCGANSLELLERVRIMAKDRGYRVTSVDIAVLADEPRLADHVSIMRKNIADCLGLSVGRVGLKATTSEGVGRWRDNPGIAAWATAVLRL